MSAFSSLSCTVAACSLLLCFAGLVHAQDCTTEISKEEAWLGEPVQLTITLYSPGPFSGTASFSFPKLDDTVIIPRGNPVLGSETVDGESLLSQRHVLLVICQRDGDLEIPAFEVRFSGKPDFVSDPVDHTALTDSVSFKVIRPDSVEPNQVIVSANSYDASQKWSTTNLDAFAPGDVLTREVTQSLTGSTAMFLPEIGSQTLDGVRIYAGSPEVGDKVDRGSLSGKRVDVLRYQFERSGEYQIPEVNLQWWNLAKQRLESIKLDGVSVTVPAQATEAEATQPSKPPHESWALKIAIGIGILAVLAWPAFVWLGTGSAESASLKRQVIDACRKDDPGETYEKFLAWRRAEGPSQVLTVDLSREWHRLSQTLFSKNESSTWDGQTFLRAFELELKRDNHSAAKTLVEQLPPLNP